jgi:DNA-binding CsgD family transcriptional regulator/tetratricopeptide (TPR) repeat protein
VLRRLATELAPAAFDELFGPGRDELARLVPQLGEPDSAADTAATGQPMARARLFELLLSLLTRLGEDAPVLLVIEDIHWADQSTLDFLAFLLASARRERILLVCSYRTDELHGRHPLRAFLAQHGRPPVVERVDLRPFTREELAAQLRGILDTTPDPDLVSRLHTRTEGNAFFTEELVAAAEEGSALPPSLRGALLLRIEALPPAAQGVLRLAAAHGRLATHRLLAAAVEMPEEELHCALRSAVAHHVLVQRDDETYAFRHALLAEALQSDLLPGERTRLHLALARALESDPALIARDGRSAAELCGHWLGAHCLPEALGAAVRAGLEAEEVYAYAEATDHFGRALELWDRVEDAADRAGMDEGALYARAAEAAALTSDGAEAIRLVRAAIEKVPPSTDRSRAALLRERLGRYVWLFSGDIAKAEEAYRDAVDLLAADEPSPELARVLAALGQILMLRGRGAESVERCEQSIAVARRAGARSEEAHALNTLGANLAVQGERRAGIDRLRQSLRMAEELGDVDGEGRTYLNLSEVIDQDGRVEEAALLALTGARRAGELGLRDWRLHLEGEAATRYFKLGRLDEADRLTATAFELRPGLAKVEQCAVRARVEVQRERAGEAESLVAAADDAVSCMPGPTWIEPLASARVELELLRGRPETARRLVERALGSAAGDEHVSFTARLHALGARAGALLAERARAAGDVPAAEEAAACARAFVDRIGGLLEPGAWRGTPPLETLAYQDACRAEAARASGAAAASDWAAVAERWAALGLRLEEAYARLREAECGLLDGDRRLAEAALAAGLRIARECGAAWLQEELEALARRGRLPTTAPTTPTRAVVERPLGLTERELAVLQLVAVGKTNREIGEQLFMAQKTASVHVSRILAKLDVSSRVEAAMAAQRLGLVP